MHVHDNASEIFFFIDGRCRLEVGGRDELFAPGDFVLVPPGVPHNLWNDGDDELLVFWMVAPHFEDNMWRTDGFDSAADDEPVFRGRLKAGELSSDSNIRSRVIDLDESEVSGAVGREQEAVLYLLDGRAQATVGSEPTELTTNEFIHVPPETQYALRSQAGACSLVVLEVGEQGSEESDAV